MSDQGWTLATGTGAPFEGILLYPEVTRGSILFHPLPIPSHSLSIPFWHLRIASFCPRVISMWKV